MPIGWICSSELKHQLFDPDAISMPVLHNGHSGSRPILVARQRKRRKGALWQLWEPCGSHVGAMGEPWGLQGSSLDYSYCIGYEGDKLLEDVLRRIPCTKQEIIHSRQTRCTSGGVHGRFPATIENQHLEKFMMVGRTWASCFTIQAQLDLNCGSVLVLTHG